MSPLGRARRDGAIVRLSVAQGALRAESSGTKGKLLRKGFGNGRQIAAVAAQYLPSICYHSKTMPDYYDKPPVSNHNELHSNKTAGRQLVIFRKTMPRSEISNSS